MNLPDNLLYSKEHEWVRVDGDLVTIGITDYAQSNLGDIVFTELPGEGETVKRGETFGVVESVKAVSDCYSPVTGAVTETNTPLADSPETLNEDCYGEGWMIKVKLEDLTELDELMDPKQYEIFVTEETA